MLYITKVSHLEALQIAKEKLAADAFNKGLLSGSPSEARGPERRKVNTPPPAKELLMSEPTITVETMNDLLKLLQAGDGRGRKRKGSGFKRSKPTPEETALRRKANDEECVRKFTAQGHKDVKPRLNVLTFGKWVEKGRQVRKGEKGTQVGPFNLFHESQTDPITATSAASVGTVTTAPASPKAEVKAIVTEAVKTLLGDKPAVEVPAPVMAKVIAAADKANKEAKSDWTEWNS